MLTHCNCTLTPPNCTQSASQSANAAAAAAGADDSSGTGAVLNSTVAAGGLAAQVAYRKPLKGEDPEVIYVQVTRRSFFLQFF
jgi:hypothetical protein